MQVMLGCIPDGWDPRDLHLCSLDLPVGSTSRVSLDYRRPVREQVGQSCVGNSVAHAIELYSDLNGVQCPRLSAGYVYAMSRWGGGSWMISDSGTHIRSAFRAVRYWGVCRESEWDPIVVGINDEPNALAKMDAADRYAELGDLSYHRTASSEIDTALHAGLPVVGGLPIGSDWYAHDGSTPLGAPESSLGNHAVVIVGITTDGDYEIINSCGPGWGRNGRGVLSRSYVTGSAFDLWTGRVKWI